MICGLLFLENFLVLVSEEKEKETSLIDLFV